LLPVIEEVYAAFNSGNHILTAIGVRTAFDRISELLGATPEKSFGEKVKFLSSTGLIGATEENALNVLVKAGNAVIHQRWSTDAEGLGLLISILENLVYRNLVVKMDASLLEARIPPEGTTGTELVPILRVVRAGKASSKPRANAGSDRGQCNALKQQWRAER
jgi:hypothetical protein